jgi:hypothetical protein
MNDETLRELRRAVGLIKQSASPSIEETMGEVLGGILFANAMASISACRCPGRHSLPVLIESMVEIGMHFGLTEATQMRMANEVFERRVQATVQRVAELPGVDGEAFLTRFGGELAEFRKYAARRAERAAAKEN